VTAKIEKSYRQPTTIQILAKVPASSISQGLLCPSE
jgi:hypothetical protein